MLAKKNLKQSTQEEYVPPLIVDEFYSAPCSSKRGKFEHRPLAMFALDFYLSGNEVLQLLARYK